LLISVQLLLGSLNLPIEALLVIEEQSSTPEEMQKNMAVVDECGNPSGGACISPHPRYIIPPFYPLSSSKSGDACAVAAGIYDCGKKKAPGMTDAIEKSVISSSSSVPPAVSHTHKRFF
jgi:hypothetical protein